MLTSLNLFAAMAVATALIGGYMWLRHPGRNKKQMAKEVGMNNPPKK